MKTIQLHVPDNFTNKVSHLTTNVETFIPDLVRTKVNEIEAPPISLADQYRMGAIENKSIQNDFTSIDLEGWNNEY